MKSQVNTGSYMTAYVIHESDKYGRFVIGVASTLHKAESMFREYYGQYKEISFKYGEENIIWERVILDSDGDKATVWIEVFTVDEL